VNNTCTFTQYFCKMDAKPDAYSTHNPHAAQEQPLWSTMQKHAGTPGA
jgi:hypothetical protein